MASKYLFAVVKHLLDLFGRIVIIVFHPSARAEYYESIRTCSYGYLQGTAVDTELVRFSIAFE
jgi:hypothetical protein